MPFDELPGEVRPDTRIVACSHVSWATGRVMDTAPLAASGALVLLDGAQGLGAVPVDVRALGCDFYAASGQKWLCGPSGMGYLYASAELVPSLPAPWSGYHALEWSEEALGRRSSRTRAGSAPASRAHHVEWSHASLDVLEEAGIDAVHERAVELAERLAELLRERGVRWRRAAPPRSSPSRWPIPRRFVERAAAEGIVIRYLPGRPWARASVGAWNTEEELERLAKRRPTCRR